MCENALILQNKISKNKIKNKKTLYLIYKSLDPAPWFRWQRIILINKLVMQNELAKLGVVHNRTHTS